jgi:hypothetical protein
LLFVLKLRQAASDALRIAICLRYQALVKLVLTDARLVSSDKQNALSGGIEGE